jgi:hypothetical protein
MAYYNNTNFYSTSSAFGEPDAYQFLSQTSAAEEVNDQAYGTFANGWGMAGQPGPVVGSPTNLRDVANYGKYHCRLFVDQRLRRESLDSVASSASYATWVDGYGQPSYSGHYWPAAGQQAQSYHSGFSSRDDSFASTVASETSTVVPIPSSGKYLFYFSTLRNRVLTDHDQSRSTTGGLTGADPLPARSTR